MSVIIEYPTEKDVAIDVEGVDSDGASSHQTLNALIAEGIYFNVFLCYTDLLMAYSQIINMRSLYEQCPGRRSHGYFAEIKYALLSWHRLGVYQCWAGSLV